MRKVLLIIRDGWGYGRHYRGNAITNAKTPNNNYYIKKYPTSIIQCCGNAVGNPKGAQGGSEVGHLTLGAGRIVWQPYELINQKIKNGEFFKNKELLKAIENCRKQNSNLHLGGLFSTEGVHADYRHMLAILELCKKEKFNRVFVHLCLDGRDMKEKSALLILKKTEKKIKELKLGKIVSVVGRYYGMDRDTNWDRTSKAYDLMVDGVGFKAKTAKDAITLAYARGDKTDYYIQPTIIVDKNNKPLALLKDGDSFIWYNFRTDRSRQITAMLNSLSFCTKKPAHKIKLHFVCFSRYDSNWRLPVAFPQEEVKNNLGQVIAAKGLNQLRIAETEKFAHVTFFFNSQKEEPNKHEDRIMISSPKVSSYDQQPEMSAFKVTKKLLKQIGKHDFIALNYANPDLVGHSGVFNAVVKACEVVDECVGKVVKKALEKDYVVFLTADHGNAEHMLNEDGSIAPSHGTNPVLLTVIDDSKIIKKLSSGGMKDIAPTILDAMGLKKPKEMTGKSLLNHH